VVTHVLAIDSTKYHEFIASADDGIFAGCVCAQCGGDNINLTRSWVSRGFLVRSEYQRLSVVLAKCHDCKSRERVLPCDVLPGKVNSVDNIFTAISDVKNGSFLTAAAERAGVSRQCVRLWMHGVAARYLDLAQFYRNRAMVVPYGDSSHGTLVMFWAFVIQTGILLPTIDLGAIGLGVIKAARHGLEKAWAFSDLGFC